LPVIWIARIDATTMTVGSFASSWFNRSAGPADLILAVTGPALRVG
jgi:hypothetical protein